MPTITTHAGASSITSILGLVDSRFEVVDGIPTFFCLPGRSPAGAAEEAHGYASAAKVGVRLVLDDRSVDIGPADVMFFHKPGLRNT